MSLPKVSLPALHKMRQEGEKIAMMSCSDYSFAALEDAAGVDIVFIGDSLGMTVQGHDSTLPVTLDEMVYHTRIVARGVKRAMVMGDLPFATYQEGPQQAYRSAARLTAAGAHIVKLEGGAIFSDCVEFMAARGIPVCAHIGLTPQFVHQLGGYRVQGKTAEAGERLLQDALQLQNAGASAIVLEAIPVELGRQITDQLTIPTIGIGAGPHCSGQILIVYDALGIYPGKRAKFVRNFMEGADSVQQAVINFVRAVKDGSFPGPEHCY